MAAIVKLDLIGDPLIDFWNNGEDVTICMGGAANTEQNILTLTFEDYIKNGKLTFSTGFATPWLFGDSISKEGLDVGDSLLYPAKYYLLTPEQDQWITQDASHHPKTCINVPRSVRWSHEEDPIYKILVVSDYNKGFVEKHLEELVEDKKYNICILDSRYGKTDFKFLRDHADILVWRRTKRTDADVQFDWDYKIETDADQPVVVYRHNNTEMFKVPVLSTNPPVSTCGAGDACTAALAVYFATDFIKQTEEARFAEEDGFAQLAYMTPPFETVLKQAVIFSQICCEDAVKNPYTCLVRTIRA